MTLLTKEMYEWESSTNYATRGLFFNYVFCFQMSCTLIWLCKRYMLPDIYYVVERFQDERGGRRGREHDAAAYGKKKNDPKEHE